MRILLFVLFAICSTGARAQTQAIDKITGYYGGDGLFMRVIVLDKKSHRLAAEVQTGVPNCIGDFAGIGILNTNVVKLYPVGDDLESAPACIVELTFDGKHVTATEAPDCSYFHGHTCRLDGEMGKIKSNQMPNPTYRLDEIRKKNRK